MYDLNFYIAVPLKPVIYDLAKNNPIFWNRPTEDTLSANLDGAKCDGNLIAEIGLRLTGKENNSTYHAYICALCEVISKGPKLIKPSHEECIALENIKINLGFDYYQQPYKAVLIELPETYRQYYLKVNNAEAPRAIINYLDKDVNVMYRNHIFNRHKTNHVIYNLKNIESTIEEAITQDFEDNNADEHLRKIERICYNLNLIMVCQGFLSKGFRDHKYRVHQARQKPTDLEILDFAQKIYKTERIKYRDNTTIGTHSSPKPHWRSGHLRNQHYGKGNLQTRLVYIAPVFVRYDDRPLDQTSVEYYP